MKKHILSIVLFVALSTAGFAQKKTVEDRAKKPTEMMATSLSLTEDQKATIFNANVEKMKAVDALKLAAGEGNKPDAEAMKAVNKTFSDIVKATLTDEQKAKQKELKAQQDAKKAAGQN